jgi:TPR repeat protein
MISDAYCGYDEGVSAYKKGDYKTAYEEFKSLAEQGEAKAQSYLGSMYLAGEGMPRNYIEAIKWFRKAVEPRGWLGIEMRTITPDIAQILGNDGAKGVIVANVLPNGPAERGGIRRGDIVKRINEKQVENPDQLLLSMATLIPGTPVTVDVMREGKLESFNFSIGEFSLAAAQFGLASMYFNGWGVLKDYSEAMKWFQKAADQGDAEAQVNLGGMYFNGQGVKQDYAEAVKWFQKAAEQGDTYAQNNLGVMYSKGQGLKQDYAEALKWFQYAAEKGYAEAQFNLGAIYFNGQGVPKDYSEAVTWFQRAAEKGHVEAQNKLKELSASGSTPNGNAPPGMASAGNFKKFQDTMKDQRFTYQKALNFNEFFTYQKGSNKPPIIMISARNCKGYCCEGLIVAQPMSDTELAGYVGIVYIYLQDTLRSLGRDFVDLVEFSEAGRVRLLVDQVMTNLKQSHRTEFAFDNLNVRGECHPVAEKDYRAGKRPSLMIKLWIP